MPPTSTSHPPGPHPSTHNLFRPAIIGTLSLSLLLSACAPGPRLGRGPRSAAPTTEWTRSQATRPQQILRCYYVHPDHLQTMLDDLGDVARPVRGPLLMGNGAVAIGLQNANGRWLRCTETGGQLLVPGLPGDSFRLVVENRTDIPLEVLPSIDGLDLHTGTDTDLTLRGTIIPRRGKITFSQQTTADGTDRPLLFQSVTQSEAIQRISTQGTTGTIQVAVFQPAGADTFDQRNSIQRRQQREFPQRHTIPTIRPYQYR